MKHQYYIHVGFFLHYILVNKEVYMLEEMGTYVSASGSLINDLCADFLYF